MKQMDRSTFIEHLGNTIVGAGYEVALNPSRIPNRRIWNHDPAYLFRGLKYKPDLLVDLGDSVAIVEARTAPILLGGVVQARKSSDYFGVPVIVCFPDDVVEEIPNSVMRFAEELEVPMCGVSDIDKALEDRSSGRIEPRAARM